MTKPPRAPPPPPEVIRELIVSRAEFKRLRDDLVAHFIEVHAGRFCRGPSCSRPVVADGLCASHYQQRRRAPSRPLRPVGARKAAEHRISVRVSDAVMRQLRKSGAPRTVAADVLARWAAGRPGLDEEAAPE